MKIMPVRPNITFFSWSKMLFISLFVALVLGALAWMWTEILGFESSDKIGFLSGAIWLLLAYWNWSAWKLKWKNNRWNRWLSGAIYVLYVGGYFWMSGVLFWSKTLVGLWNIVILALLVFLLIFVLAVPALNHKLAAKLHAFHGNIDGQFIGCGGISLIGLAGVCGYWLQKTLGRDEWMIVVSMLGSIVGLGFIQHQFFEVWQTRPWAQEGE